MSMTQKEKAVRFRALHREGRMLVLPNAWDVISARIFEEAGFPAIATTSAGVAFTLGYPDGQVISREEMLSVVKRIAQRVQVPVSADMESGYGTYSLEETLKSIQGVLDSGAVGINLEDSVKENNLIDKGFQVEKIRAIRQLADSVDIPLVINARTDPYFLPHLSQEEKFETAVDRAHAYLEAGADSIFVPLATDATTIGNLVKAIPAPLNILLLNSTPSLAELEALGVRRVSMGSGAHRMSLGLVRRLATEVQEHGSYETMLHETIPSREANALLTSL